MYHPRSTRLLTHVTSDRSRRRTEPSSEEASGPVPAPALDLAMAVLAEDALVQEDAVLAPVVPEQRGVRSVSALRAAQEVGAWALEYIGPGFRVQLRISRRGREARLDGWMSPARPARVVLSSLVHRATALEARISESGRFEFVGVPTGPCRMSFLLGGERTPATPPFWI